MKTITYYSMSDSNGNILSYFGNYSDLNGKPIKRNPITHPYSYYPFVEYKNNYKNTDTIVYSDRMRQWDWDKQNKCCEEVFGNLGHHFSNRSHDDIEKYLSLYFDKDIELTLVMNECNLSNGFPCWRFAFRDKEMK